MISNNFLEIFDENVKKCYNDVAIIFNDNKISYLELSEQSDKIAKTIINNDVKPGSVIALGLYNDIDLIPSILAIWKANCVYCPIDPNYPSNRIENMFKNACPKLLITKNELRFKFSFFKEKIYYIDKNHHIPDVILRRAKLDDLAYLMYTSGSTGIPKGIVVDHFALKHSAIAYNELHPEKRIALVAGSISFDPSLLVIISTLAKGGTLCLYNNRNGIDISKSQNIVDLIDKNLINFILSAPVFYSKLIEQNRVLSSLKNVDLCGENFSNNLVNSHKKISPNAFLHNVYGPTEYAMGVTAKLVYDPKEKKSYDISIGKPFSCNKIYILDPNMDRLKPGDKGEIYVAGPGLAKGYFNQEKITKKRFLLVEHLESEPIRVYRTGDMGYCLPNGEVVFIGRSDQQVKINGHRVELEEVEKFISKYPQIEKVVTLVREEENNNLLVAFFSGAERVLPNLLREFLAEKLPSYMIPSAFIQINEWPITNNGKIDKNALKSVL